MITSGGNRNPAKLDRGAGAARRRGISPAFLSRPSVNATEPQGEVGPPAFDHALRDGYFQLVVAHRDSPMASALVPRLETFGYRLSDRVADARFPDLPAEWLIYERWS